MREEGCTGVNPENQEEGDKNKVETLESSEGGFGTPGDDGVGEFC